MNTYLYLFIYLPILALWALNDLDIRPLQYQCSALTNWAKCPCAVFPAVNHFPIERPLCIIFRVGFIVERPDSNRYNGNHWISNPVKSRVPNSLVASTNFATSPNLAYATLDVGLYTSPLLGDSDKKVKTLKRAFTETLSYSAALLL